MIRMVPRAERNEIWRAEKLTRERDGMRQSLQQIYQHRYSRRTNRIGCQCSEDSRSCSRVHWFLTILTSEYGTLILSFLVYPLVFAFTSFTSQPAVSDPRSLSVAAADPRLIYISLPR
jgi:hypothetical protein